MKKRTIMKSFLCVAMSVAMSFSILPVGSVQAANMTDELEKETNKFPGEGGSEPLEENTKEIVQEEKELETVIDEETFEDEVKEVAEEEIVEEEVIISEKEAPVFYASSYVYDVDYEQKEINKRAVTVSLPNLEKLLQVNSADSVKIEAELLYNGNAVHVVEKTVKLEDIEIEKTIELEMPTYGKYYFSTSFIKEGKVVKQTNEMVVGVTAEEYNFAILNATFPVVQFTLSLWDMKGDSETPVPTFVSLSRNDAYDWEKLPENVYDLPYITDANRESVGYTNKMKMTAAFIKELYELNPDSKFNLFSVDYTLTAMLYAIVENNIPMDQYSVRVLSDGTASYAYFNERFNNKNPQAVYDELAKEWNNVRDEYAKGNRVPLTSLKYGTNSDSSSLKYYTYVIVNEEKERGADIEWWLARTNGTLLSEDADFLAKACRTVENGGVIRLTAFNTMLNELTSKGEEIQKEFKDLYHFSETMFEVAEKNDKKVMMLLGTRVTGEADFEDYARFCMLYYGDEYEYYYKGHPATPTAMYPEKQSQLNTLGMHDVESSIAAELILYFYPNISMSGYDSTTFISASEEMACCLFNKTLDSAYNTTNGCDYKNTIDFCISKINDYSTYELKGINKENRNYLIEFNKIVDKSSYDIGVWDATASCIFYYTLKDGEYVLAKKELATRPVVSAKGGQNQVELTWNEVAGADQYKIYSYDEATKKYTGVKTLTGTSYTVKNLKDGTKYAYLVRARVNGSWSTYNTANHAVAYTIPSKPVVKVKGGNNSVTLSWSPVKSATKYRIYSYNNETKKYTKIEDITNTSVTYKKLEDGTDYTYLVRACNETDFSPFKRSDNVRATTLCKKPVVVAAAGQNSITLSWNSVPGADRYRVYKYSLVTKEYTGIGNVTGNSYTVKKLKAGTKYAYLVRAYNGTNYSSYTLSDVVNCKTKCEKPAVKATAGKKSVTLSWKAVKGATKYRIYSYNSSTKKYTKITDVKGTKYTVDGLSKGKTYRYLVRAYNGTVFSSYSTSDNVKAKAK